MNKPPVKALLQLFSQGQCSTEPALKTLLIGLAHPDKDKYSSKESSGWTISKRLLSCRASLTSDEEAVAAVLATDHCIRQSWLAVMAGRTREAGKLDNPEALVQLVTRLGAAASWVEQALPSASLASTNHNALERQLFGSGVEQNQSLPALTRVLATAAVLNQWQNLELSSESAAEKNLNPLEPVDATGKQPDTNWCKGRLLILPKYPSVDVSFQNQTLLPGIISSPLQSVPGSPSMSKESASNTSKEEESWQWLWACSSPWLFLLSALVYTQDSWAAEQWGGLILELPAGQQPTSPSEIQVLVEGSEGDEVLCGTLAELLLRVLDAMGMALFPYTPNNNELNNLLSPVIHQLLKHQLWRYHEGLSGEQGYYRIDPDFADDCYKIDGSIIFGRRARPLWQTIRLQAEQWRAEKQNRAIYQQNQPAPGMPSDEMTRNEKANNEKANNEKPFGDKTGVSV